MNAFVRLLEVDRVIVIGVKPTVAREDRNQRLGERPMSRALARRERRRQAGGCDRRSLASLDDRVKRPGVAAVGEEEQASAACVFAQARPDLVHRPARLGRVSDVDVVGREPRRTAFAQAVPRVVDDEGPALARRRGDRLQRVAAGCERRGLVFEKRHVFGGHAAIEERLREHAVEPPRLRERREPGLLPLEDAYEQRPRRRRIPRRPRLGGARAP